MVDSTMSQLDAINPYHLWQVQSYNNVRGYDKHAFICYDCFAFFQYANNYNILISSAATDSVPNLTVVHD